MGRDRVGGKGEDGRQGSDVEKNIYSTDTLSSLLSIVSSIEDCNTSIKRQQKKHKRGLDRIGSDRIGSKRNEM